MSLVIILICIIFIILITTILFARFEWAQRASYIFVGLAFTMTAYSIYRTYIKDSELLLENQRQSRDSYHNRILTEFMNNNNLDSLYKDMYGNVNVKEHAMYQLMLQSMENILDEYKYSNIDSYWLNMWIKWFNNKEFKSYFDDIKDEYKPELVSFVYKNILH